MEIIVQCDGQGNNEVVFYTMVGSNMEKVSIPIAEIQGLKYKKMSKRMKTDEGFRYRVASLLIGGADCISVKDIVPSR